MRRLVCLFERSPDLADTSIQRIPASDLDDDGKTLVHCVNTRIVPELTHNLRSSLADELRAMSHPAFMDLARMMYKSLLRCIERLHREGALVVEVLQGLR